MLPKKERLSQSLEIKRVLRNRQYKSKGPLLSLTACDSQQTGPRLAIVTPGKIGNAVIRNRLRRIYSEAFRQIRHNIAKNIDFVLFPSQKSIGLRSSQAAGALKKALIRAGIVDNVKDC